MEKSKGFCYMIEGFSSIEKFAKGILCLVNIKSSRGNVVDFKTYENSWTVKVIAREEMDSYLNSYIGNITSKEPIEIVEFEYDDLTKENQKVISDIEDSENDLYISISNS